MGEWADTDWGRQCAAIAAEVTARFPTIGGTAIEVDIGPDPSSKIKVFPALTFVHRDEAHIEPAVRNRWPWDQLAPIYCEVWMPDATTAESVWKQVLRGIDKVAHGRAGMPGRWRPKGGNIGTAGAKYAGTFILRLGIYDFPETAQPETATVTTIEVSGPDGDDAEELPLGS